MIPAGEGGQGLVEMMVTTMLIAIGLLLVSVTLQDAVRTWVEAVAAFVSLPVP